METQKYRSHYHYLDEHVEEFFTSLGLDFSLCYAGIVSAHGDKGLCYKRKWENAGIHYYHGMMLYLLSYTSLAKGQVRETSGDWKDPGQWVIETYPHYKDRLPSVD